MATTPGLKSNVNCCVPGCKSVRKNAPNLMYHSFPKMGDKIPVLDDNRELQHLERRQLWIVKLKMGKKPTNSMTVCSLHFNEDDYMQSGAWNIRKRLKPTAVPSKNLPVSLLNLHNKTEKQTKGKTSRSERLTKRNSKTKTVLCELEPSSVYHECCNKDEAANALLLLSQQIPPANTPKSFCNKGTQVDFEDFKTSNDVGVQVDASSLLTISDFVHTDKQLSSLTGIHSFSFMTALVMVLSNVLKDSRLHRLSIKNRLFLTFVKLKLDLPYVVLAIMFGVSSQTCKTIFHNIVATLSPIMMNCTIPFPTAHEIQLNMPMCFKDFKKTRIVLDCTEIPIQSHKKLCCRVKTYSHYKGTTTIKFMTGVSPAGLITFISAPYGGRVSDKAIFEQSGLLNKLDMYKDEIMVDKGFLIEDLCWEYGINIVRPPFLKKKLQLTAEESLKNSKIASARVHIERTNQRIKVFKILTNRLPVYLIPSIDDIFTIVCGIVNLSNPILANDKFLK